MSKNKKPRQVQTSFRSPLARLMPMPDYMRKRLVLRAYSALDCLVCGSQGADKEAWRDLADVVNVTETLSAKLNWLSANALYYTSQANDSMRASQARYLAGKSLRLDGPGIEALRAVIAIYDQCLRLLTEMQVEEAFKRTADEVRALIDSGVEAVSL